MFNRLTEFEGSKSHQQHVAIEMSTPTKSVVQASPAASALSMAEFFKGWLFSFFFFFSKTL
jgi:hypothetical protein